MDTLKSLLEKRKSNIKPVSPSKKWVKQSDLEKERLEKYMTEQQEVEKKKQEALERRLKDQEEFFSSSFPSKKLKKEPVELTKTKSEKTIGETEEETQKNSLPPLPKNEVIRRLRNIGQPITLFGEDEWMRYNRLRKGESETLDTVEKGLGGEGNTFQKDLQLNEDEFKKLKEVNEDEEDKQLLEKLKVHTFDFDIMNNQDFKSKKKIVLSKGVSYQNKCDDVYIWCKKILNEWEQMLQAKPEKEKNSLDGKQAVGIYRQCRRYLKPMFQLLKEKTLNEEILDALYHIVHYCLLREYVKAHDKYLEISIGNSPWPMGVTMVGIHERSGRAKIFSSQVAHILNDETQRKYLQAFKRLITLAQKLYPNDDPTKCILT